MKLAVDCRSINWYNGTGIGTYTENLMKNLLSIDKTNEYNLVWHGSSYENFKTTNSKILFSSKKQSTFFNNYFIPNYIEKNHIELYHIPQNGIGHSSNLPCKTVVTIHDLIPYVLPETVGNGYLIKFLKQMPDIISNCDAIITVSEFSKRDIQRFFPHKDKKIFVTHLAADKIYHPIDKTKCKKYLKNTYGIDFPYILYLGGYSKRKNIKFLLECFSNLKRKNIYLVLGGQIRSEMESILNLCNKLLITDRVVFPGYIPVNDLPMFYNACELFTYPSLYEGFGLPPLEAMSCGCAVISSNSTSIPEIVCDGGLLLDVNDHKIFSNSIDDVLSDNELRYKLSTDALLRSSKFSWNKTSENTLDIYKNLIQ